MQIKICSKCKKEKPATSMFFTKNRTSKSGFRSTCKLCSNKTKIKPDYYNESGELLKYCSVCKKFYPANKKYFHENNRNKNGLYSKCKECQNKISRDLDNKIRNSSNIDDYKNKYKECTKCGNKYPATKDYFVKQIGRKYNLSSHCKNCRKNNAKIYRKKPEYNEGIRYKLKNDKNFAIKMRLSSRIRTAVKNQYSEKAFSTIELLGCTIEQFTTYFKSKFKPDMTWEAFMNGEIHIDHIKPCALFDLTQESEQQKCFHYTNLQPLWAKDNLSKGAKYGT